MHESDHDHRRAERAEDAPRDRRRGAEAEVLDQEDAQEIRTPGAEHLEHDRFVQVAAPRRPDRGALVMITSSHFIGPDLDHAQPVHIQRAAQRFPEVDFVIGHASWPWTLQAIAVAMRCPNVYLMPEFYMYLARMPGASHYVDALNTFLRHRVLYSSCAPSRSVGHALALARALDIVDASREPFFGGSARRLLGLA